MKRSLFVVLFLAILFMLSGCHDYRDDYFALRQQYEDLTLELEDIGYSKESFLSCKNDLEDLFSEISSLSDDSLTVTAYFDREGVPFKEAYDACERLRAFFRKYE